MAAAAPAARVGDTDGCGGVRGGTNSLECGRKSVALAELDSCCCCCCCVLKSVALAEEERVLAGAVGSGAVTCSDGMLTAATPATLFVDAVKCGEGWRVTAGGVPLQDLSGSIGRTVPKEPASRTVACDTLATS